MKKGGFDWLVSQDVDIFCVQETKAQSDQLPENILKPTGYVSYFDHSKLRKGYSGVAIWTKKVPEKVEYGFGVEKLDKEGRQIALFFNSDATVGAKLAFINTYFPNGGGGQERLKYKLEYYDEFLKYIEKIRKNGYSIIFCGDVNTAHTEIDLARPKENSESTGFLPIERQWIDKVVEKGYVDIFRKENPDKVGAYTYWDMQTYARERNVGWRIDYFFISPDLLPKIKSSKILDSVFGSDHCPISLEFN